ARAETGNFEPVDGAVFAREFREPFHRMGGVNVEEVADQQVAGWARNRLKMRRVFHSVSPPCAFQRRQSAADAPSVQAETETGKLAQAAIQKDRSDDAKWRRQLLFKSPEVRFGPRSHKTLDLWGSPACLPSRP